MAIQHMGTNFGTTSVVIPTHAVGDLLILNLFRLSSITPTLPSGWTAIRHAANTNYGGLSGRMCYQFATGTVSNFTVNTTTHHSISVLRNVESIIISDIYSVNIAYGQYLQRPWGSTTFPSTDGSHEVYYQMLSDGTGNDFTSAYNAIDRPKFQLLSVVNSGITWMSINGITRAENDAAPVNAVYRATGVRGFYGAIGIVPSAPVGFDHLDISNSGLINAASGSGNYLELSNSGYIRKAGTEGTNSLILDASGRIVTKGS